MNQGSDSERSDPDLPEIGIEALGMNRVRRTGRGFAQPYELREVAERRHSVDADCLAVARLRQLDLAKPQNRIERGSGARPASAAGSARRSSSPASRSRRSLRVSPRRKKRTAEPYWGSIRP